MKKEIFMEVDRIGVHATHCCTKCGCKYGDEDCPVATGEVAPVYKCQDCEEAREDLIEHLLALSPEEVASVLAEVEVRRAGGER